MARAAHGREDVHLPCQGTGRLSYAEEGGRYVAMATLIICVCALLHHLHVYTFHTVTI